MTVRIAAKTKREPHPIKARLSKDVHIILASCLHQFEKQDRFGEEECFDVDAILAGRPQPVRQLVERRTNRAQATYRPYKNTLPHGTFIPHTHLFNSVVRAHQ